MVLQRRHGRTTVLAEGRLFFVLAGHLEPSRAGPIQRVRVGDHLRAWSKPQLWDGGTQCQHTDSHKTPRLMKPLPPPLSRSPHPTLCPLPPLLPPSSCSLSLSARPCSPPARRGSASTRSSRSRTCTAVSQPAAPHFSISQGGEEPTERGEQGENRGSRGAEREREIRSRRQQERQNEGQERAEEAKEGAEGEEGEGHAAELLKSSHWHTRSAPSHG